MSANLNTKLLVIAKCGNVGIGWHLKFIRFCDMIIKSHKTFIYERIPMIAEEINDLKKFMNFLLASDKFDSFLVNSISITTFNTFQIDGHICKDFYTEDEFNDLPEQKLSSYKVLRPICYNLIKGHKTPVKMKLIFAMNDALIHSLIQSSNTTLTINDVNELFINIKYENGTASCTTGVSLKIFTMDKSLEQAFDKYISNFISTLC